MAEEARPEVKAAITKAMIAEAVLLLAGVAIFFVTDELWGVVVAIFGGPAILMFLLAQAGALEKRK